MAEKASDGQIPPLGPPQNRDDRYGQPPSPAQPVTLMPPVELTKGQACVGEVVHNTASLEIKTKSPYLAQVNTVDLRGQGPIQGPESPAKKNSAWNMFQLCIRCKCHAPESKLRLGLANRSASHMRNPA